MGGLLYREDMDEVRRRLTIWWNGGDIGRPALQISYPLQAPREEIPELAQPSGWATAYSTKDFVYRLNYELCRGLRTGYLAEAAPNTSVCLGPNTLALYLGCRGVEQPGTVWFEPCLHTHALDAFPSEQGNFYWDFTRRLAAAELREGRGKFLIQFPDLIEGLDTLAALHGTQCLLTDLLDRPKWVQACLRRITDRYFYYYDILYDLIRDEVGGSVFWAWAPGRMVKLQCDFSAMMSPQIFGEFMVPVLTEMTERISYSMYHWDGPGALCHHDHLLSIPGLKMLQWTPGAGNEPVWHEKWWPLYHKTVEAGKKVFIGVDTLDTLRRIKREFGTRMKQFLIGIGVNSLQEGEEMIKVAEI